MLDPRYISQIIGEAVTVRQSILGRVIEVQDMLTRVPAFDILETSRNLPYEFVAFSRALDALRLAYVALAEAQREIDERDRDGGAL